MKIRLDFVTNSSSSSYLLAITGDFEAEEELLDKLMVSADLGPSWKRRLSHFFSKARVSELEGLEWGYNEANTEEHGIDLLIDDRHNYLPEKEIFFIEIQVGEEIELTMEEKIIEAFYESISNTVLLTETTDY